MTASDSETRMPANILGIAAGNTMRHISPTRGIWSAVQRAGLFGFS
jgi:hypothetical protein